MANSKREKSSKYPGVYWRNVERKDGHGLERMYYIIYRRGGRDVKTIEEPIGRASEGITEAKASIRRAERINGITESNKEKRQANEKKKLAGDGPLTFARLWEIYASATSTNASHAGDEYNYRKHLEERLAKKQITAITSADISHIRRSMEGGGLAPQTVKHGLGLIRRILRYGVKLGLCSMPDHLFFDMPKVDNQKTENMTREQLAAYWRALDEEADQDAAAFLRLELLTGIRRGAMMALRWDDIDIERGIITLRGESAKSGKTSHLPLSRAALDVISRIARQGEFVFPGKDGGQRKCFRRMARRVRDKAGLPSDFRYNHGLRHTFASQLASSGGVSLYEIQKLLTHSSPAMTQRYAHLADEALRRAVNVADSMISEKD